MGLILQKCILVVRVVGLVTNNITVPHNLTICLFSLRVRLFWVKMISGNHFPPNPHVWLQWKMKFSRNSFPVDQYLLLWPGNNFTLLFSVQIISTERERERERESPDRRERERKKRLRRRSTSGAIIRRARSSIAIVSALVDRRAARSSVGRDRGAARSSGERARRSRHSSDDRTDLAFTARSHLLLRYAISIWLDLMNFFAGFCFFCEWVWNWFIICMFTVEEVCGKLGM